MNYIKIPELIVLMMISFSSALTRNPVCPRLENYTVTSMETYTEPVVVNTFTWCLQIPPRCPKIRTEMRLRYRLKTETKTRKIDECCQGFRLEVSPEDDNDSSTINCVPLCENCLSGICISPDTCVCLPGYHGDNCDHKCQPGLWGPECIYKCDCGQNVTCDHVDGKCKCPPGLQGLKCDEQCTEGRWGPGCMYECECKRPQNICHPETGECLENVDEFVQVLNVPEMFSSLLNSSEELPQTTSVSVTEYDDEEIRRLPETTKLAEEDDNRAVSISTEYVPETVNIESTSVSTLEYNESKMTTNKIPDFEMNSSVPKSDPLDLQKDPSTTSRPVIVLVSVPERRRNVENDRSKFSLQESFLRHIKGQSELRDNASPKTDFVKTLHKDISPPPAPVPLDIALIVVASIVSLGLTSIAVVMVLHIRSKLFETVRFSIYDDGKTKSQEREGTGAGKIPTIVSGNVLSQSPVRVNPVFASNPETGTILTLDNIDPSNIYANGAATIGLRISGNLRDLLQDGHYDRPTATLIRLQTAADFEANTEHLYDEIPLQSTPLCNRKSA